MAKHIHIYLPTAKTRDEQKHAPAGSSNGGQFVTSGSSGGNAAHHEARSAFHVGEAKKKGPSSPDYENHKQAHIAHNAAALILKDANKEGTPAQGTLANAQNSANKAAEHEGKLKATSAKTAPAKEADITKHPQYSKEDHDYLTGKGWSNSEIAKRWDEEKAAGKDPQTVNKNSPAMQAKFKATGQAMGITKQ